MADTIHSTKDVSRPLTGHEKQMQARHEFDQLTLEWHRLLLTMRDAETDQELVKELEKGVRDLELARQIFAYPVVHRCNMTDKLDVLVHYASTVGEDMSPHERIVLLGINALRADLVHFGG